MGCWNEVAPSFAARNAVAAAIQSNPIETLILGGDNVYPKKVRIGDKKHKTYSLNVLNEGMRLYDGKRIHIALGNHNVYNPDIKHRVLELAHMKEGTTYYCKKFKDNCAIVVIDTNLVENMADFAKMAAWITETIHMLRSAHMPYYLIQHEPFFSYKKGEANELKYGVDILRIIVAYPPVLVLCADTHNYQENMITVGGVKIKQIVAGTGGAHHDLLGDTSSKIDHADIQYTIENHIPGFGYLEVPALGAHEFKFVAPWPMAGGLNLKKVEDSEFKYTRNTDRIKWTKHAIPIGEYLITCVRNIPWLDYKYSGKTTLWVADEESRCTSDEIEIYADLPREPYYFFGGCVYEILNALALAERSRHPDIPYVNLRDYVDPTGDVDVKLVLPRVRPAQEVDFDYSEYVLKDDGTHMTALLDHYTQWIFDKLREQIESHAAIFDRLFENTERFELAEEPLEAAHADVFVRIGNIWLVRVLDTDLPMVKIQVVAKFLDTEPDHILELVLELTKKCDGNTIFQLDIAPLTSITTVKHGLRMSALSELIDGNNGGIKSRLKTHNDDELRHKFFNHVGRLQYLNNYLPTLSPRDREEFVGNKLNTNRELIILFTTLAESIKKGQLPLYSYNRSNNTANSNGEILRSLISNFIVLTDKTSRPADKFGGQIPAEKIFEILNPYLLAKGGYKRHTRRKPRRFRKRTSVSTRYYPHPLRPSAQ